MKPKTKKILIIAAALAIVAVIAWLLFFRKKGWEKVIDDLDISNADKKKLKTQVEAIVSDSEFDKEYYAAAAARSQLSYDQYLVLEAASYLKWPCGKNGDGSISVTPN